MKRTFALILIMATPVMSADITITIPDAAVPRVINAMAAVHGYEETINGQPNPETKAQFARRMLLKYLRDVTLGYEMVLERKIADDELRTAELQKLSEYGF